MKAPLEMSVKALESMREPALITQLVLCSLAALEGADNQLLGATAKYTAPQLSFTLNAFTTMSIFQGVGNNLAAPLWGIAADRNLAEQRKLMIIAALGQGFITCLLAWVTEYGWFMVMLRFFNGLFLAGLRPIANGIVAKNTSEGSRGKIFSRVQSFILLGGSLCSAVVTPLAGQTYFGLEQQGWRIAWYMVGLLSALVSVFTATCLQLAPQPPPNPDDKVMDILAEELWIFVSFLRKPTFSFMVLQGIFGTIPWTVMWMNTLYYQLAGLTDVEAGLATALSPLFGVIGVYIGGYLGDTSAALLGLHGRPLTAQLTVSLGIPFLYYHYFGLQPQFQSFFTFVALNAGFGIFGNWAQAGTNWPVLSEIVNQEVMSRVLAMESAIENTMATILGPLVVQYLGQNVFSFELKDIGSDPDAPADYYLASRFGACLCLTVVLPFSCAFIVYSLLHWAFPSDVYQLEQEAGARGAVDQQAASRRSQDGLGAYMFSRTNSTLHA